MERIASAMGRPKKKLSYSDKPSPSLEGMNPSLEMRKFIVSIPSTYAEMIQELGDGSNRVGIMKLVESHHVWIKEELLKLRYLRGVE